MMYGKHVFAAVVGSFLLCQPNPALAGGHHHERGFFSNLLYSLYSLLPRDDSAQYRKTATMGIRGKETTESALQPLWEGDLTRNPAFKQGVERLRSGIQACQSGDVEKGVNILRPVYSQDEFRALQQNAALALAACYGLKGDKKKSEALMAKFIKENPDHPLADRVRKRE